MRNILIVFVFLIFYGCGYSAVYNINGKQDILIKVQNTSGDTYMNNYIENNLKIISNSNSKKVYNLNINTDYEKIIVAKNASGRATDYKLDMQVSFELIAQKKQLNFNENIIIKHNDEKFEQSNYEKEIKKNFAKIVVDKLNMYLIRLDDN